MSLLVRRDGLKVLIEGGIVSGSGELSLGIVLQTLAVEGVLEVLKGKRVVQDLNIGDGSGLTLLNVRILCECMAHGNSYLGDDWSGEDSGSCHEGGECVLHICGSRILIVWN